MKLLVNISKKSSYHPKMECSSGAMSCNFSAMEYSIDAIINH
jgi:hypothetical protein